MTHFFQLSEIKAEDIFCIKGENGELGAGTFGMVVLGFLKKEKLIAAKCSRFHGGAKQKENIRKRLVIVVCVRERIQRGRWHCVMAFPFLPDFTPTSAQIIIQIY